MTVEERGALQPFVSALLLASQLSLGAGFFYFYVCAPRWKGSPSSLDRRNLSALSGGVFIGTAGQELNSANHGHHNQDLKESRSVASPTDCTSPASPTDSAVISVVSGR